MEVKIDKLTPSTFKDLNYGDVFVEFPIDNPENNTYLVISRDYSLGIEEGFEGYAVDLKTGEIYGFYNSDRIVKMNAKLIATMPMLT